MSWVLMQRPSRFFGPSMVHNSCSCGINLQLLVGKETSCMGPVWCVRKIQYFLAGTVWSVLALQCFEGDWLAPACFCFAAAAAVCFFFAGVCKALASLGAVAAAVYVGVRHARCCLPAVLAVYANWYPSRDLPACGCLRVSRRSYPAWLG